MSVARTLAAPYRERRKGTNSTPICPFAPVTSTRGEAAEEEAKRRESRPKDVNFEEKEEEEL